METDLAIFTALGACLVVISCMWFMRWAIKLVIKQNKNTKKFESYLDLKLNWMQQQVEIRGLQKNYNTILDHNTKLRQVIKRIHKE